MTYLNIPIADIRANPDQPRKHFDQEKLRELADSIKEHGVIQPIGVQKNGKGYILIHGERRWRASKMAGKRTIPAVVFDGVDERTRLERALVENLQREEMNAIEEAQAFRVLIEVHGLTTNEVAKKVGKSWSIIKHRLLLLELQPEVQEMIASGELVRDGRVAIALLTLPNGVQKVMAKGMRGMGIKGILRAVDAYHDRKNRKINHSPQTRRKVKSTKKVKFPDIAPAIKFSRGCLVEDEAAVASIQKTCFSCAFSEGGVGDEAVCIECPLTLFVVNCYG